MTTEQGAPEAGAWKTVPVEPTEAMIEAHFEAHAKANTVFADVRDVWRAMLASSPSPPPVGVGADWRPENAFITCCAAKPDYYVRFDFRTLKEAQEFHRFVVTPPAAPPVGGEVVKLAISDLQAAHIERQEEWCPDQKPDLSFRGNEMAGETGEACNVIKKLERERHGWRGSRATKQQLAEELADVVHTAILCAITAGIDLEPAVVEKFNSTSEKNGLASRIRSALVPSSPPCLKKWERR